MENVVRMFNDFVKVRLKWCYKYMEYLCFRYFFFYVGKDNKIGLDYFINLIVVIIDIYNKDGVL